MDEPIWVDMPEVLVAHSRQLAEHGGFDGLRDATHLECALGKPRNVFASSDSPSLPLLAALYATEIAKNHPFVDGSKRTALVIAEGFLGFNGLKIVVPPEEKCLTYLHLADGSLTEEELAAWFTAHAVPL